VFLNSSSVLFNSSLAIFNFSSSEVRDAQTSWKPFFSFSRVSMSTEYCWTSEAAHSSCSSRSYSRAFEVRSSCCSVSKAAEDLTAESSCRAHCVCRSAISSFRCATSLRDNCSLSAHRCHNHYCLYINLS